MYFLFAFAVSVVFYECHKKVSAENGVAENDSRGFGVQFGLVWFGLVLVSGFVYIIHYCLFFNNACPLKTENKRKRNAAP